MQFWAADRILTCSFTQSRFSGKHFSLFLSLSLLPVSPSASLKEATHHGAWRMCAAGHLCNRKATLIMLNITTTQFSLLAKASGQQGCRVRPLRTHWHGSNENVQLPAAFFPAVCGWSQYSYRRLSIVIHIGKSILSCKICTLLIRTDSLVYSWH